MTLKSYSWRLVFDSVKGTSHVDSDQPCQDSCKIMVHEAAEGDVLIAACADGAGSAAHSDEGSKIACDVFIELGEQFLRDECSSDPLTKDVVEYWLQEIRDGIQVKAVELDVEVRQLATTFLACIVRPAGSVFIQIGDGAMVYRSNEDLQYAFWPHTGEYANMTNFLTSDDYIEKYEWKLVDDEIDEIAIFTDGLERLLLRFEDRAVHSPAIAPMLNLIKEGDSADQFTEPLRQWLSSDAVNQRTDDDKSLILAVRVDE